MEKGQHHPAKKKKRRKILLLSIIIFLIAIRLALPSIVLHYTNKTLANLNGYYGQVEDIDIALIRGAYTINNIKIEKIDSVTKQKDSIPFFVSPAIDLSVHWSAIFKGSIVGEIKVINPVLNFVKEKQPSKDTKTDTTGIESTIKNMMPLTINHIEIENGEIHYIDNYSAPPVDISITNIQAVASNLTNKPDSGNLLPSSLTASAYTYEGDINLNIKFNILAIHPTFDLTTRVTNVNMVFLNDFFKAYGNFDLKKGNFSLYSEVASKDGSFNGYVKPVIKDLDIVQWNNEEGNTAQVLWETVIGGVSEIFQNQPEEQLATKIPISGKFENPDASLWIAINYVLKNAFVQALQPSIDNTINIGKVEERKDEKTFLQKIFGN